jgi:ribosomal protein L22
MAEEEQEIEEGGEAPAQAAESSVAEEPAAEQELSAEEPPVAETAAEAAKPKRRRRKAAEAKEPVAEEPAAEEPAEEEEAAAEPAPAPARRRDGAARRAAVSARARYVRTSARKARMVSGHLRGKSVQEARAILAFTPRDAARDWSKVLESAVANAENNHELLEDDLVVLAAYADEGPTIKRFRPRAMGRATPIRKRTSHLTITLTPRS